MGFMAQRALAAARLLTVLVLALASCALLRASGTDGSALPRPRAPAATVTDDAATPGVVGATEADEGEMATLKDPLQLETRRRSVATAVMLSDDRDPSAGSGVVRRGLTSAFRKCEKNLEEQKELKRECKAELEVQTVANEECTGALEKQTSLKEAFLAALEEETALKQACTTELEEETALRQACAIELEEETALKQNCTAALEELESQILADEEAAAAVATQFCVPDGSAAAVPGYP